MNRASSFFLLSVLGFSAFAAFGKASPAAAEAMFMSLRVKEARGISADGEVVVGGVTAFSPWGGPSAGTWSLRWKEDAITNLGGLPATLGLPLGACDVDPFGGTPWEDQVCLGVAEAASADGSVVVGRSGRSAFRWESGSIMPLCQSGGGGGGSGGSSGGTALDVSADGSVVLSTCGTFRWTEAGDLVQLDRPGGGGLSADGSVVVGVSRSFRHPGSAPEGCPPVRIDDPPITREAFRWELTGSCDPHGPDNPCMVGLGDLPGGAFDSEATDVSADGSVVVGKSQSDLCSEAFRWEDGVMAGLGTVTDGGESTAHAVSADGSVVVGDSIGGVYPFSTIEAFVWTERAEMRSVRNVLVDEFGLDLTGWTLTSALGVSDDGLTIMGNGINPDGAQEGWIAVLQSTIAVEIDIKPGSDLNPINPMSRGVIPVAILGSEAFDVADVDLTTLAFGPDGAPLAHRNGPHVKYVNHDGLDDLLAHFPTEKTGIAFGDEEACVTGEALDGTPFEGCDAITTEPKCGIGFELALLLPPLMWLRSRTRRGAP